MEAIIIEKQAMKLAGLAAKVTLHDVLANKTTLQLASNFYKRKAELVNGLNEVVVFGVSTDPEDYNPDTDEFEYFIGMEVSSQEELPDGMVYREIPANTYVLFTFKGRYENTGSVHQYLYSSWLQHSGYELSGLYNIEIYDERHHGPESDDSITDICFPVRRASVSTTGL
jgi:Uncharacterized protein conserved in bacteria